MKTKSFLTFILFFCISITFLDLNAQELSKTSRPSKFDGLNQDQLNLALSTSLKTIKTGKTLTFVGIGAFAIGAIITEGALNSDDDINEKLPKVLGGALLGTAGEISAGIGILLWIVGASNKNKIEIKLAKFGPTSYSNGIGVRITF
jgi:hypothetical protein